MKPRSEADQRAHRKAAVLDEHDRHREKAEEILKLSPKEYLGWSWVEAIVTEAGRLRGDVEKILAFLEEEGHRDLAADVRRSVLDSQWGK